MTVKTMTHLERSIAALSQKLEPYNALFNYYDGHHPQVYVASRLREIFRNLDLEFQVNWCSVVIDSTTDRINLKGFTIASPPGAQDVITRIWDQNELFLESEDVLEATLITGEAFLIAWKEADDQQDLESGDHWDIYYNDPRLVHVFYNPSTPREKDFAAKWWQDDQRFIHVVLYYVDRIEHWKTIASVKEGSKAPDKQSYYALLEPPQPHDLGIVPVFHFRTNRRSYKSDLHDVIPLQDGVNKLLADMLVAAEFAAFRQKWIISNAEIDDLKNQPGTIMDLPAADGIGQATQVGEFSETPLGNYIAAMDNLAENIAAITRTPKHYFFSGEGQAPSGDALTAMEAPLVKKAEKRIERLSPVWREVVAFILKQENVDIQSWDITPVFEDPATIQPLSQAQVRQTNVASGIPLITQLRQEGWTDQELTQLAKDQKTQKKAEQSTLASALMQAQTQMSRGIEEQNRVDDSEE